VGKITFAPGLRVGTSYEDYAAVDALNNSTLQQMKRSAAHARYYLDHSDESTVPQLVGEATHAAVLEPERFAKGYVPRPEFEGHHNSNKYKEARAAWEAGHQGDVVLSLDEFSMCEHMRDAAWAHPAARALLDGKGSNEVMVMWSDPGTQIPCKARLDRFTALKGDSIIVEVKTARDASAWRFGYDAAKYGYHEQAAWYRRGLRVLEPKERRHLTIALEKEPPWGVAVYEIDKECLDASEGRLQELVFKYAECVANGVWPGYPSGITALSLPKYAYGSGDSDEG